MARVERAGLDMRTPPQPLGLAAFYLVAGAGFEPATFSYEPDELPDCSPPRARQRARDVRLRAGDPAAQLLRQGFPFSG